MSTLNRAAAGFALLGALAAGGGSVAATHSGSVRHQPRPPAQAPAPAPPANPIPQGHGGDGDGDNSGGPSDMDGNV
jgi:hypothetical protein